MLFLFYFCIIVLEKAGIGRFLFPELFVVKFCFYSKDTRIPEDGQTHAWAGAQPSRLSQPRCLSLRVHRLDAHQPATTRGRAGKGGGGLERAGRSKGLARCAPVGTG
jgi:hypothetical protein